MRILFVLEHYYPYVGGVERLFKNLCESLVNANHDVDVITTRHDAQIPYQEVINGVQIRRLSVVNRFLFTFLSLPSILKLAGRCDLIHTTSYNAALPAYIAAKISGKPILITFHEVWTKLWDKLPYLRTLERVSFSAYEKMILSLNFDRFTAVSGYTHDSLIEAGINADKLSMIYNGVDYSNLIDLKRPKLKSKYFTYFGRLGVSKGLDLLIPALARLSNTYSEFKLLLIVPEVPKIMFETICGLIEENKIQAQVTLKHNLSDKELSEHIINSEFVVIPSYSEGFCFCAVEAIGMGVPVVTSGRGALKEVVSGEYIEMKELSIDGLVLAIEAGIKGQWNETPIKRFPIEQTVQEYIECYQGLLDT